MKYEDIKPGQCFRAKNSRDLLLKLKDGKYITIHNPNRDFSACNGEVEYLDWSIDLNAFDIEDITLKKVEEKPILFSSLSDGSVFYAKDDVYVCNYTKIREIKVGHEYFNCVRKSDSRLFWFAADREVTKNANANS